MDAYELAKQLLRCICDGSTDLVCVEEAAYILRQQADRIAELEKQVVIWEKATMDARIKSAVEKQSEPVAWMSPDGKVSQTEGRLFYIPLYTTPHHASDVKQTKLLKCIVKDCENHMHEGRFIGDLCNPCYEFITTGKGIYSQAYRNTQTKPLSDEEIVSEWISNERNYYNFARAIEERHGIK